MEKYSLKKGISKAVISLISLFAAFVMFSKFSNVPITELITTYVFPLIGSMTVGAAVTFVVNAIKFHLTNWVNSQK